MSESQLVVLFESQSWVNVKVVKRWRKKLNEHNNVYLSPQTMWNLTKTFSQFQWFFSGNYPKSTKNMQTKKPFSQLIFFWKLTSGRFWKCDGFVCFHCQMLSGGEKKIPKLVHNRCTRCNLCNLFNLYNTWHFCNTLTIILQYFYKTNISKYLEILLML